MEKYKEIEGNLITLALTGSFDVISHGTNCFCVQGAGIAPQMVNAFGTDEFDLEQTTKRIYYDGGDYYLEDTGNKGNINKLGNIDYQLKYIWLKHPSGKPYAMGHKTSGQKDVLDLYVVNSYSQYHYGKNHKDGVSSPIDYEALTLCMRKINHTFKGLHVGLPQIGCGLGGGNWEKVKEIIQRELCDVNVTIVFYKP
jgi:O-acetyl-ADP-ribose deacetylase (regulator of RNase III)